MPATIISRFGLLDAEIAAYDIGRNAGRAGEEEAMKMLRKMAMWAAAGGFMLALGTTGQGIGYPGADTPAGPPDGLIVAPDAKTAKMEKAQRDQMNADRQKKLVADTARLLELATELKAEVDKSNKDTLSLDVVRKADAIEKLAHSVKEGMKGN
jgi:hypothetical protein